MTMKFKPTKAKANIFGQLESGAVFRLSAFGDLYVKVDPNDFMSGQNIPANTLCFTDYTLYHTDDDDKVLPTTLIVEEE
jgi:hypothetical protein